MKLMHTIYFDPPAPVFSIAKSLLECKHSKLRQIYPCRLDDHESTVLIDNGASHNFINPAYAEELGLHITPKDGSVHVVANTTVKLSGSCRLQLKVGKKYCRRVTFGLWISLSFLEISGSINTRCSCVMASMPK